MNASRRKSKISLGLTCVLIALVAVLFGLPEIQTAQADESTAELRSTNLNIQANDSSVELYRLYNLYTSEHLYTTDTAERDRLQASIWRYEGTACTIPTQSSTPVYRLYSPSLGKHHYTTSTQERDWLMQNWWNYEGIGWFSDYNKRVAMHRLYHHGLSQHHYTSIEDEFTSLTSVHKWADEGVGWYAISIGEPIASPYGDPNEIVKKLKLSIDIRPEFSHGEKGAQYQKYIVLHDTTMDIDAAATLQFWVDQGQGIATHFVVNKDGSVLQCVPLDQIAHHAGQGTSGHNRLFGVDNSLRDDVSAFGSSPGIERGMNAYSIGIEIVHSGNNPYPTTQLEALDNLIAYIDAYYGFPSTIIDHKMWRVTNGDTSEAFTQYLANYRDHRSYR